MIGQHPSNFVDETILGHGFLGETSRAILGIGGAGRFGAGPARALEQILDLHFAALALLPSPG